MKRNYAAVLFRAVVVLFVITVIFYEVIKTLQKEDALKDLFSSSNGLIFSLKFVAIPAFLGWIVWKVFQWIIRGLDAPPLNWNEGLNRVLECVKLILAAVVIISTFNWLLERDVIPVWSIIFSCAAGGIFFGLWVAIDRVVDWLKRGFEGR